jgi:hypothetical protein
MAALTADSARACLGLAVHSGWAVAVAIAERDRRPLLLARVRIELSDERQPESRQPYHAVTPLPLATAAERLTTWERLAARMAQEAIGAIAGRLAGAGHALGAVAILDAADRKPGTLEAILASHALVHAAEGRHFRTALAKGAGACGLAVQRVSARALDADASAALGRPAAALRATILRLGREAGPPWRADHKAAALAAWLALARGPGR